MPLTPIMVFKHPHIPRSLTHTNNTPLRVDAGGAVPLHERGWRIEGAKMPLKESVAAAMLMS